jgi:sugar phosphate isomerase/epimerase
MPPFSISQITTLTASFADDVAAYRGAGADGIGIWELKLPEGGDAHALEELDASGLGSAAAVPVIPSILPLPLLEGPAEPAARVEAICSSLHRLAPFRPSGIVCLTGPAQELDRDRAVEIVVDGLRVIGDEAERAGVRIGLEPVNSIGGEDWTIVSTIQAAVELLEAADAPAVGLQFDTWHLWNTGSLLEDIERESHRFVGVHVADWRRPTRSWADRVLPGDGVADLPAILRALERAGWDGFYDVEIFSDNGTFGNAWEDALWDAAPDDLARRARASFARVWDRRIREPAEEVSLRADGLGGTTTGGGA